MSSSIELSDAEPSVSSSSSYSPSVTRSATRSCSLAGGNTRPGKLYTLRNVKLDRSIGHGAFGNVYRGLVTLPRNRDARTEQLIANGPVVAVKAIAKHKVAAKGLEKQLALEITVHRLMVHPNIIRFLDYSHDAKDVYIFLEYADGGDLFKYVRKRDLPEAVFANLMRQVGEAVLFCHSYGIVHRDLKPENILMLGDVPKLTDFGYCDKITSKGVCKDQNFCGTPDFVSPEMCEGSPCGFPVDVWAIGAIIYDLRTGQPPFYAPSRADTYKRIAECDVDLNEPLVRNVASLLRRIFVLEPDNRPTMREVLQHPWFALK